MPDEDAPSVSRGLLRALRTPRGAAIVVCGIVATVSLFAISGASGAAGNASPPDTAQATASVSSDASVLASFGLLPRFSKADGDTFEAIGAFVDAAARPTATASPQPTATAVAPSPIPPTIVPAPPRVQAAPTHVPPTAAPTLPAAAPTEAPAPPPPPPPPVAPPVAPRQGSALDTSPMDAKSQQLFDLTNKRRVASGLAPLRPNLQLAGIARIRSQDMADHNYFAHVSPVTGDNAFTLMDAHAVPYGWAGENLAKNNYSDAETVGIAEEALWNSAPHRENILGANYTDMGIALAVGVDGMKYFTIIFTGPA